jgi:hypothetical protein
MFIKNKYTKYYYQIVENAANRIIKGYTEEHHIIPQSMGGDNSVDNLVRLTGHEHFVCHLLLTKMLDGPLQHKAVKAARMMATVTGPGQQRYKVTGRVYELLKQQIIEVTDETRKKMATSQKKRFANSPGTFKNKTHTEKTKQKMRKPRTEEQKLQQSLKMKGRFKGRVPHNKGKTFEELYGTKRATELKEKVKRTGEKNGFYGKKHTAEQRLKKSIEKIDAPKKVCYYCNMEVDAMNYGRWHGDRCKHRK